MSKLELGHIKDFTTSQYIELLKLAKINYKFIGYQDIPRNERFILWRHDCDYSLNRSLRLAKIENKEQIKSTYFLNPHCDFYNLLEKSQSQIVREIITLGHDIGLHFDAGFYNIQSENQLDKLVKKEATWLNDWFGIMPTVFSFHNPTEFLLSCDRESYGDLLNCYSKMFKDTISYCSDSNGYWRFRRLRDVLEKGTDLRLQVLTHPAWWQEKPMYPRERIFRTVYGRAKFTMNSYDQGLQIHKRDNLCGFTANLNFLRQIDSDLYQFYDYLWSTDKLTSLFIELYRLYEHQIIQFCRVKFDREWQISAHEIDIFFADDVYSSNKWTLFQAVFNESISDICKVSIDSHPQWMKIFNQLVYGQVYDLSIKLKEGCIYLCNIIQNLVNWGQTNKSIQHNGITQIVEVDTISNDTNDVQRAKTHHLSNVNWQEFCQKLKLINQQTITEKKV